MRFSDVGWTDITATTALTSRLLQGLGYRTTTQILSIPVTYASIKNRQIDVYLGDWQPSMEEDRKPFLADGSVQVVRANPVPMAAWGLIVAAALVIGSIPALLGLVVVMPVLGHATWHLYRKVVPR